MAYIGRPGATAPLTSADIPDNTITASKIVDGAVDFQNELGFLENASGTQNLTGTYSTERMYLNDSYTLTGDVTVTGHLSLGTIADSDVVITQDSTERTITGSGTLESGRLMNDYQSSLTGMTGELGSTVTQASGYTLGSGVTFPAGHILQVVNYQYNTEKSNSSNTLADTGLEGEITLSSATNKILVIFSINGVAKETGNTSTYIVSQYRIGTGSWGNNLSYGSRNGITASTSKNNIGSVAGTYIISPASLNTVGVKFVFASQSNIAAAQVQEASACSQLTLMEVVA